MNSPVFCEKIGAAGEDMREFSRRADMREDMNGSNANLALNILLAVGVAATLIGGLALLFADSRAPKGVIIVTPERPLAESRTPTATATPSAIGVYVSGAVDKPGVYELPSDSRADDALAAAGGASPDADLERVNLAKRVSDGEHIRVPKRGDPAAPAAQTSPLPPTYAQTGGDAPPLPDGKIDVNSANADSLETLPGIGPARARAIVEHRQANGPFAGVDDLTEVRGIGEGILDSIRDLIEAR